MHLNIRIQSGLLQQDEWIEELKSLAKRLALVTDHTVKELWGIPLEKRLKAHGFEVHLLSVPPGEASKTRSVKASLEDQMLEAGLSRDSALLALGGGVITDLGGCVAATYCRGIPLIAIPTTLMAQVDASIGGKVGLNTPHGKNLIGSFYPAHRVLIDPEMLQTLPEHEVRNGMAEVIKYGLIASELLVKRIESGLPPEEFLTECCQIKQEIVAKDPYETGLRRVLNFGHTVGHALEILSNHTLRHGEAVAIGIVGEAYLSHRLGLLSQEELARIEALVRGVGFSLKMPQGDLISPMRLDKKGLQGRPRVVCLEKIGEAVAFEGTYCCPIEDSLLEEMQKWLRLK